MTRLLIAIVLLGCASPRPLPASPNLTAPRPTAPAPPESQSSAAADPKPDAASQDLSATSSPIGAVDVGASPPPGRQFKFARFFYDLKRRVASQWQPDHTRGWSGGDRVSVVQVQLKADGSVATLTLHRSCGDASLDAEALTAFKRAAPFSPPPKALLDHEDGLLKFRFHFSLKAPPSQ
jgi:TonB family protein